MIILLIPCRLLFLESFKILTYICVLFNDGLFLQDFDLDEAFGQVAAAEDIEGVIEVTARMSGAPGVHEFGLKVSH